MLVFFILTERGVEYEFRVSAKNSVDYGEPSSEKLTTPEGSELFSCFIQCIISVCTFSVFFAVKSLWVVRINWLLSFSLPLGLF